MGHCLIIGYGNSLRSDDGAGQTVAEAFFDIKGVEAIAIHQLTPELAENIARAEQVYFVDATPIDQLKICPIEAIENERTFGHFVDPRALLNLTFTLYAYVPMSYLVLIPAINFELGETFSPLTQAAILEAISLLKERISPCMK